MLKHISIILNDAAPSYCHYETNFENKLISLEDLKEGVVFAMKNNLSIQFIYPDTEIPNEYKEVIDSIDHISIKSFENKIIDAQVIVINGWKDELTSANLDSNMVYLMRLTKEDLFAHTTDIANLFGKVNRLNIVVNNIESFTNNDFDLYKKALETFTDTITRLYTEGRYPQTNILTDRIMLEGMNNCNAGVENITLAPDGKFYVCPAFYYAGKCDGTEKYQNDICQKGFSIGSLIDGVDIKLPQLYKLDHAPLCRHCDAYHCKRCIWLNRKTTLEVNTPSHEQCVIAHLERNASRNLLSNIQKAINALTDVKIPEIDYLDPFDIRSRWLK